MATVKDICGELARRPMQFVIAYTENGKQVTVLRNVAAEAAKEILERAQEVI